MLPVPPDHGEEVRTECAAGLVVAETPDDGVARLHDGLLDLVGHFHPCHSLHLVLHKRISNVRKT